MRAETDRRRILFDDNRLRVLYVEKGLSAKRIAKMLGCSEYPVACRIKHLGLVR